MGINRLKSQSATTVQSSAILMEIKTDWQVEKYLILIGVFLYNDNTIL